MQVLQATSQIGTKRKLHCSPMSVLTRKVTSTRKCSSKFQSLTSYTFLDESIAFAYEGLNYIPPISMPLHDEEVFKL